MEGWAKIKGAARYAGISVRTWRGWLKNGLRHVRLETGTIPVKYSWIDDYLLQHEVDADKDKREIENAVDETLKGLI